MFCGDRTFTEDGVYAYSCYFSIYWISIMGTLLFLSFFALAIYICWNKRTFKGGIFKTLQRLLISPARSSFCQYLTESTSVNNFCYYLLISAALFVVPLTHITFSLKNASEVSSDTVAYWLAVLSSFFRVLSLFIIFVAMEVIYMRSYYIMKNKSNLPSSAVSSAERRKLARFMIKKSLILSFIIFISESVYLGLYPGHLKGSNQFYIIMRFLEFLLIFIMVLPKLSLLDYEKLLLEQSKYISMASHRDSLMKKHLEEIQIHKDNIPPLIEELIENMDTGCQECGLRGKLCSHLADTFIEQRFDILRNRMTENQEIAVSNLVEMLPTNARNTVGSLKIVLIVILVDFAINSLIFGLMLLTTSLDDNLTRIISIIRITCRFIRFFTIPIIIWVVLNERRSFGEFHSVLERSELRECASNEGIYLSTDTLLRSSESQSDYSAL